MFAVGYGSGVMNELLEKITQWSQIEQKRRERDRKGGEGEGVGERERVEREK